MGDSDAQNPPSRLRENIVSMFVLQGANYILPLMTVPYLVRVLGPDGYGRIAFAQAFIAYFTILVDYGFDLSATRRVALLRRDQVALSRFVSSVMAVKIVFALLGFCIVLAICAVEPRFTADRALYVVSYIAVAGSVLFPLWLFRGLELMRAMSALAIAGRAVTVIATFLLVHDESDILLAGVVQASALAIVGFPALILLLRISDIRPTLVGLREISSVLRDGWHAFLSTSAITLYTTTNTFVLGLFCAPAIVGYYSGAIKIISAVNGLFSPVNQSIYPHVTVLFEKSKEKAFQLMARVIAVQSVVAALLSIFVFIFSNTLVFYVLGKYYAESGHILKIVAILPLGSTLTNIFGVQIMMALGMKEVFLRVIFSSAAINLIIIFPLVMGVGAEGAACAVLFVEIFTPLMMLFALRRHGVFREMREAWARSGAGSVGLGGLM